MAGGNPPGYSEHREMAGGNPPAVSEAQEMLGGNPPANQSCREISETLMANRSGAASSAISDEKVGFSWSEKANYPALGWREVSGMERAVFPGVWTAAMYLQCGSFSPFAFRPMKAFDVFAPSSRRPAV